MDWKMIYDLLKEVREDQKKHGEELIKQSVCLDGLEKNVDKNTKDLTYHIHRTDVLEGLYKTSEERITKLEEPEKAAAYLKKKWKFYVGVLVGILTIGSTVAKLIGLI